MPLNSDAVEAVAFDSYGTIVDVTAVEEPLSEYVDRPKLVSKIWRERSLNYAMVSNHVGEYDSFYEMNRAALRYALTVAGADVSDDEREEILSTYDELDVFEDAPKGMDRLHEAGYDLYVLSNGSPEMLDQLLDHAGIDDVVEDTISVAEIERFKPDAEMYRHAADRIGVDVQHVAFVAGGWWDVPGAVNAGVQGVWVNRQDALWGPYEIEPDLTVEDFHAVADRLNA
jgi:2-haloacid dehalogenase